MQIYKLKPLSVCETNSYIIAGEQGNAVLIDAPDNADYILSEIESKGLKLKKVLLTHGHFDHVGAVADIAERTGCEVYIHKADLSKLTDENKSLASHFGTGSVRPYANAIAVSDGDSINMDELEFKVIHTPGHTSGSVCYVVDGCMFSGDTLFARSIGRTDMPDGNTLYMLQSLEKLSKIEQDLKVYPGHMSETTLDIEKKYNPYMKRFLK